MGKTALVEQNRSAQDASPVEELNAANVSGTAGDVPPGDGMAALQPDLEWGQDLDVVLSTETHARALVATTLVAMSLAWLLVAQGSKGLPKARWVTGPRPDDARVEELHVELEAMRLAMASQSEELSSLRQQVQQSIRDLPLAIHDETSEHATARFVRIQCPGVTHDDIEIMIIFNGAVVKIDRKDSQLAPGLTWSRQFQFQLDEGHFEFKEEEARLEYGILQLVFRASTPQPRVFRFPQHFDLISSAACGASSWTSAANAEQDPAVRCAASPPDDVASEPGAPGCEWACVVRPPPDSEASSGLWAPGQCHPPSVFLLPPTSVTALSPLPTESSMRCAASCTASSRSSC